MKTPEQLITDSDTPRTDKALDALAEDQRNQVTYNGSTFVAFARQLERELMAAYKELANTKEQYINSLLRME